MTKPGKQEMEAAQLAAAAFDLWEEQCRLLAEDAGMPEDMQVMLDFMTKNMGLWAEIMKSKGQGGYAGIKTSSRASARHSKKRPTASVAALHDGGQNLVELASALGGLAKRVERIERHLEKQRGRTPSSANSRSSRRPRRG